MMTLADQMRQKGNDFLAKGEYEEAMKHYSEAIELYSADYKDLKSQCYASRAVCYLKQVNYF